MIKSTQKTKGSGKINVVSNGKAKMNFHENFIKVKRCQMGCLGGVKWEGKNDLREVETLM